MTSGVRRVIGAAVVLLLPALALANGAMGLGLEQWAYEYWEAYVAATVLFEAWMIGGWLRLAWWKSIGLSILANAVTGLCCAGGFCAPGLHQAFVGGQVNPNPLLNAVVLLTLFSVPSALVESVAWIRAAPRERHMALLGRAVLTHLLGIPLALAILLIPERPYIGLERITQGGRYMALMRFTASIADEAHKAGRLPRFATKEEQRVLLETLGGPNMWAAFYTPEFHRFDTGECRRRPAIVTWNTSLSGAKIGNFCGDDCIRTLLWWRNDSGTHRITVDLRDVRFDFRSLRRSEESQRPEPPYTDR